MPTPTQIARNPKLWYRFVGAMGCPEQFDELTQAERREYAAVLLGEVCQRSARMAKAA